MYTHPDVWLGFNVLYMDITSAESGRPKNFILDNMRSSSVASSVPKEASRPESSTLHQPKHKSGTVPKYLKVTHTVIPVPKLEVQKAHLSRYVIFHPESRNIRIKKQTFY